MRLSLVALALAILAASAACKETGTIKVHSLYFKGVKAVDESQLKDALATHQSSKIPWGKKSFFDRSRFDADLKRDPGVLRRPRLSRRARHRLRRQAQRQAGRGRSDRDDRRRRPGDGRSRSTSPASTRFRAAHLDDLKKRVPLKVGQPRDRQLVVSTHEMARQRAEGPRLPVRARSRPAKTTARRQAGDADVHRRAGQARAFRRRRGRRQQERRRARHPPRS